MSGDAGAIINAMNEVGGRLVVSIGVLGAVIALVGLAIVVVIALKL